MLNCKCTSTSFQVIAGRFLEIYGMSKEEVEAEIRSDRFPPYILYQIIYTGEAQDRVKYTLVKVHLHGANVPLSFNCRIEEEKCECLCTCGICGCLFVVYMCECAPTHVCVCVYAILSLFRPIRLQYSHNVMAQKSLHQQNWVDSSN